jgi:predicted N-formylglutamate amidohydrolase
VRVAGARSPYVFTCDHAGNRLPRRLGNLGLSALELDSHIAWDRGIAGLGTKLAERLNAFLIMQSYSRLVIDVNRPLASAESIVSRSEHSFVAGNCGLSSAQIEERQQAVFVPYHDRIRRELDLRHAARQPTILVALHSFTPVFMNVRRSVEVGVLYGRYDRLGRALLEELREDRALQVGENEPYAFGDDTDYTLVEHGQQRGLPHVELELRQDLIDDDDKQRMWAARLGLALERTTSAVFPA